MPLCTDWYNCDGCACTQAGWTQVFDVQALEAFVTKAPVSRTNSSTTTANTTAATSESYITMRANRRLGFNSYSDGYIGGDEGYVREVYGLVDPTKLGVPEKLIITFVDAKSGFATVRDGNRRFWSYDTSRSILAWVSDEKQALQVQIFLKADSKDALFFKSSSGSSGSGSGSGDNSKFVSFRGALYEATIAHTGALTLLSLLSENAFFLAPKAKVKATNTMTLNGYNLKQRRQVLEDSGKEGNQAPQSTPFIAYDLALAVPLSKSFNEFMTSQPREFEFYNLLLTMSQLIVLDLAKEYEGLGYTSLGKALPAKIDLNEFALAVNASAGAMTYAGVTLGAEATNIVRGSGEDTDAIKWGAFLGAVISRAQLRGLDANSVAFASYTFTYSQVLNQFYMHSCILANLLPSDKFSTLDKLKETEMLYPQGSLDPYVEKNAADGKYWFESFVVLNITSLKNANILPELGLLQNLPTDFLANNTMVGDGIASAITRDVTALFDKNDIKALAKYASEDAFVAASSVASAVCPQEGDTDSNTSADKLKFCVIPQILSQISGLAIADRSLLSSNATTSVIPGIEMDLQAYMQQLLDKDLHDNVIKTLSDKRRELMTFLKDNMDKEATAIESATLEPMLVGSAQVAKSQSALAEHLQTVSVFDRDSRVAQFEQKLALLTKASETASGEKDSLIGSVKELSNRAIGEAAVQSVLDLFNTAISALSVFNPVTGFNPKNLGDLVTDANAFSKSLTNLVQTTLLKKYVTGDLANKLGSLFTRMASVQSDLQRVKDAVQPLIGSSSKLNSTALDQQAASFISVYSSYKSQVSQSEVEQVKALFTEIVEAFCVIIDIDGYPPCVTIPGKVVKVFGGLIESVGYSHEAVNLLFEVARAAVNLQSAVRMQSDAETQQQTTSESVKALQSNWNNNTKTREEWWTQWKKEQSYADAVSSIGLTMNQALLLSTVVSFCNYNAYENGGVASDICASTVFAGKPISDDQIELLSSYKNAKKPSTVKLTPVIPTKPQYGKDTGFLDIAKLMDGESVTFQLPLNVTWLHEHNWLPDAVTDLKSTVLYVKSFEIYLPPRFSTFETKSSDVAVEVQFSGTSSLGLALGGKSFEIPASKFKNTYEERPVGLAGTCTQVTLASRSDCSSLLPHICSTGGEVSDSSLLPSAFSTFEVQASFGKTPSGTSRISYKNVTTPLFLAARVSLVVYTGVANENAAATISDEEAGSGSEDTSEVLKGEAVTGSLLAKTAESSLAGVESIDSSSSAQGETPDAASGSASGNERRLQTSSSSSSAAAATTAKRCCAVGKYLDWASGECLACPEGSVSQLGGLYCVGLATRDSSTRVTPAASSRALRSKMEVEPCSC